MSAIRGTIEVLTGEGPDAISFGWPVMATDPDLVPGTAAGLGYTDVVTVAPRVRPGQMPAGEWTAIHPDGHAVFIVLWEETPFDETVIGRALAVARAQEVTGE